MLKFFRTIPFELRINRIFGFTRIFLRTYGTPWFMAHLSSTHIMSPEWVGIFDLRDKLHP